MRHALLVRAATSVTVCAGTAFKSSVPVLSPNVCMSFRPRPCSDAEHRVRHRRAVRRLDVQVALELAVGVAGEEQRAALVVVQVRVAHRRAVHDQRLVQQVAVAFLDALQLVQEVRQQADVVLVDLRELLDALLVARRGATPGGTACRRRSPGRRGPSRRGPILNENTRVMSAANASACRSNISLTCSLERIGHADRRARQIARLAARRCAPRCAGCAARLSRMSSRYWSRRARSSGPSVARDARHLARRPSRGCCGRCGGCAARCSGVAPTPNSCSNATRGSRIIGSGSVGDAQLMVSV